ncbi:MAG: type II toxin-antitoxin system PemK/MazF family toxin [Anaerolineales bacterium]|nr:type II toxin-antitoxin system PemK/MazF family toxin [Anaerolineales bacterium]
MPDDFDKWNTVKKQLHGRKKRSSFKDRDIVWCSIGMNVGNEVFGKSQDYTRPVLVVRRFNRDLFLGVPLTSTLSGSPYYHEITFKGNRQSVLLRQIRTFDSRRVYNVMGRLPESQFRGVLAALTAMIDNKKAP